jgi:hypothetical protein
MLSLKNNTSCTLLEQYLSYLTLVKGRSALTAEERGCFLWLLPRLLRL